VAFVEKQESTSVATGLALTGIAILLVAATVILVVIIW